MRVQVSIIIGIMIMGQLVAKPKDDRRLWEALAPHIQKHFSNAPSKEEIVADIAYAKLMASMKNSPKLLTGFDVKRIREMRFKRDKP